MAELILKVIIEIPQRGIKTPHRCTYATDRRLRTAADLGITRSLIDAGGSRLSMPSK
jgi:hypothetical protein